MANDPTSRPTSSSRSWARQTLIGCESASWLSRATGSTAMEPEKSKRTMKSQMKIDTEHGTTSRWCVTFYSGRFRRHRETTGQIELILAFILYSFVGQLVEDLDNANGELADFRSVSHKYTEYSLDIHARPKIDWRLAADCQTLDRP